MVHSFRQHTAMDEPSIQTEVDRYIPSPGQAPAYRLGQAKFVDLRQRARHALLADSPLSLEVPETRLICARPLGFETTALPP
jgi:hypothetical protein